MQRTIHFVLLDDFADWEAASLAPALRGGVLPGRPGSHAVAYLTPGGRPVRSIGGLTVTPDGPLEAPLPAHCAGLVLVGGFVTANGSATLEFTRACLLAFGADTPEAIEASYRFNKEGFYKA